MSVAIGCFIMIVAAYSPLLHETSSKKDGRKEAMYVVYAAGLLVGLWLVQRPWETMVGLPGKCVGLIMMTLGLLFLVSTIKELISVLEKSQKHREHSNS